MGWGVRVVKGIWNYGSLTFPIRITLLEHLRTSKTQITVSH